MKYLRFFSFIFLATLTAPSYAILFPVEVGQEWIYKFWDTDGNSGISSVIFDRSVTVNSVEYTVAQDGWAIHSTDNSVTGYDDINDLNSYFEFIVDSNTPIESLTTSLGTFDTAYVYHTIDPFREVRDYFVQDVGYVFLREDLFDLNGNVVLTEYAELIEVKSVPEPGVLSLFGLGVLSLALVRSRRRV